jgi:hypothetical protein
MISYPLSDSVPLYDNFFFGIWYHAQQAEEAEWSPLRPLWPLGDPIFCRCRNDAGKQKAPGRESQAPFSPLDDPPRHLLRNTRTP